MTASHRNANRHGITLLVSFIAMLAGGKAIAAETPKSAPLRVAYSAITVNQAIPWIAHDAGHFKKHGLQVELIHASSITALHALLAEANAAPASTSPLALRPPQYPAKAKRVIFLFMAGGPSQHDLFDYKTRLAKTHGERVGYWQLQQRTWFISFTRQPTES